MPLDDPRRVRRRLTRRSVVALGLIAATVTVACAGVLTTLQARTIDGHMINLAGRQRMLSQRITKAALLARHEAAPPPAAFAAELREWGDVHRALLDGDGPRGLPGVQDPETYAALGALSPEVAGVQAAGADVAAALGAGDAAAADRALGRLLRHERRFLEGMDRVVYALDAESSGAIRRLWAGVGAAWAVLMGLLVALGHYVFRPTIDGVARSMEQADERGRLLRTVVDTIPDHIYVKDAEGRATLRNRASAAALGYDGVDGGLGATDAGAPAAAGKLGEAALADDLRVVRTGVPILNQEERAPDGGWLLTTKVPLRDGEGGVVGLVGVSRDVTEAREAAAKFRGIVEHSVAGTVIIQDGRFAYANPRMEEVFGYGPGEMVGLPALSIVHEDDRATVAENLRRRIEGEVEALAYAIRGVRRDGRVVSVELAGVGSTHGGRPAVVGTVVDVTARAAMERELYHRAHHDALTGLPNRALFAARLEDALARADDDPDGDGGFAVLFVDLDRFKAVNDTLGHSAGDRLLQEVAARLQRAVRPSDTVARLGGDEFAVLLTRLPTPDHAEAVAERVLDALRPPVRLGGREASADASVGVVAGRADHAAPDAVLREADLAMYTAKGAGRGRYAVYSPGGHGPAAQRLRLEVDLRHAVDRGELRLAYQPVVRLADGALVGFEALVRWEHPEFGRLGPDAFIGPAEEGGQATAVDRWVLREACRQMAAWGGAAAALSVNVNCTGRDLLDAAYVADVRGVPAEVGFDPARLALELTESQPVEDAEAVAAELGRLQALGVRFCVDDFGTGYSSLTSLSTLPVDTVKVDRSFVGSMGTDGRSRQLVATVVGLGRVLDKTVVAEGIETPDQLAALRAMGCGYGQGYLFARPLGPDEAGALLAAAPPWRHLWAAPPARAA